MLSRSKAENNIHTHGGTISGILTFNSNCLLHLKVKKNKDFCEKKNPQPQCPLQFNRKQCEELLTQTNTRNNDIWAISCQLNTALGYFCFSHSIFMFKSKQIRRALKSILWGCHPSDGFVLFNQPNSAWSTQRRREPEREWEKKKKFFFGRSCCLVRVNQITVLRFTHAHTHTHKGDKLL